MSASATVSKWGNGVGLLIPKSIREDAGISVGDRVRLVAKEGSVTILREDAGWTLHERMQGYDGPPPEYIDPGASYGREVW